MTVALMCHLWMNLNHLCCVDSDHLSRFCLSVLLLHCFVFVDLQIARNHILARWDQSARNSWTVAMTDFLVSIQLSSWFAIALTLFVFFESYTRFQCFEAGFRGCQREPLPHAPPPLPWWAVWCSYQGCSLYRGNESIATS